MACEKQKRKGGHCAGELVSVPLMILILALSILVPISKGLRGALAACVMWPEIPLYMDRRPSKAWLKKLYFLRKVPVLAKVRRTNTMITWSICR